VSVDGTAALDPRPSPAQAHHTEENPMSTVPEQQPPCPFCEIVAGRAPATIVHEWSDVIAIAPLNPVVDGHTLVIPKRHVPDFAADPEVSADAMLHAAQLMRWTDRPMNLITSRGREATQSVTHLHLHLVLQPVISR
jgi:histidine triad (HIT) family protein